MYFSFNLVYFNFPWDLKVHLKMNNEDGLVEAKHMQALNICASPRIRSLQGQITAGRME